MCIQKPGVQSVSNEFSLVGSDHHDGLNKNISEENCFFLRLIFPALLVNSCLIGKTEGVHLYMICRLMHV